MTIEHRNRLFALLATSLCTLAVSVGCEEKPTTDSTPGAAVPATDEKAVPESASGDACPRICETANAKGCPAGKPL